MLLFLYKVLFPAAENDPDDLPPGYDEDEGIDYSIADEDVAREILDGFNLPNYESVDKVFNQSMMTPRKTKNYLNRIIKNAAKERQKFNGSKSWVTKQYNKGIYLEAEKQELYKMTDNSRAVLTDYIDYYNTRLEMMKGSGIRKKQKGGNVMFFNNVKQLLKKLELIIGETLAGNTSIEMRNMGVAILDILLKTSTINKPQYNKLYNQYFKI